MVAGIPLGNSYATGGLEALAVVLLILFVSLCIGGAIGVGIALAVKHHPRPLVTTLLAIPAMLLAVVVTLRFASIFDGEGPLILAFLIVTASGSLWLARAVAMVSRSRPGVVEVTEE